MLALTKASVDKSKARVLKFSASLKKSQVFFILLHLGVFVNITRHVKINGSPVSLTENSAVFRKTDF